MGKKLIKTRPVRQEKGKGEIAVEEPKTIIIRSDSGQSLTLVKDKVGGIEVYTTTPEKTKELDALFRRLLGSPPRDEKDRRQR